MRKLTVKTYVAKRAHEQIRRTAFEMKISISELVRRALEEYLQENPERSEALYE